MNEKLDTTIKMVSNLKNGVSHLTKELEKIQAQLEELKAVIGAKDSESQAITPTEILPAKPKKQSVVVRREDQDVPEVVETTPYKIQVVGLGIQKME